MDVGRPELRANIISGKHMDKDKAAAVWVTSNKATVKSWLKYRASGGSDRCPRRPSSSTNDTPHSPSTSPRRPMRRSLSDQAYYRIRELIVTLELRPARSSASAT